MFFSGRDTLWSIRAPGKLNLFLETLGLRPDGYHELETLMVPLGICDRLSLTVLRPETASQPAADIRLQLTRCPLARGSHARTLAGDHNLAVVALRKLQRASGCSLGAHLRLEKRIPLAAGMGGGSSDAAAALLLGNAAWQLGWDRTRLMTLGAELGSDVPFFLGGGAAICRGRGERVARLANTAPLWCVVAQPADGLSAADVYQQHARTGAGADRRRQRPNESKRAAELARALAAGDFARIGAGMFNRLQRAASQMLPWIDRIRDAFSRADFVAHQLTGSGSAYFGVCRHRRQAICLVRRLSMQNLGHLFVAGTYR